MSTVAFTETQFTMLKEMLSSRSDPVYCSMGRARLGLHEEWTCHAVGVSPEQLGRKIEVRPAKEDGPLQGQSPAQTNADGLLVVGRRGERGEIEGWTSRDGQREPVSMLRLLAPGLPMIPAQSHACLVEPNLGAQEPGKMPHRDDVRSRIARMHYAIVGTGHVGSLVATALIELRVRRLTLIDPGWVDQGDRQTNLEPGGPRSCTKVNLLAQSLRNRQQAGQIDAIPAGVTMPRALEAVARADAIWCCVDDASARLATAAVATAYLKPMSDIEVVIRGTKAMHEAVADIRLVLGDGCAACWGGPSEAENAYARLSRGWPGRLARSPDDGKTRAFPGLAQAAVDLSLELWSDCLSSCAGAAWVRIAPDHFRGLTVARLSPTPDATCVACARRGWADDALVTTV